MEHNKALKRRGYLDSSDVQEMMNWQHGGGFSLDASVRIEGRDRAGRERLFRYCARPIFASERLMWIEEGKRLRYHLKKPDRQGRTELILEPLELIDRLSKLIPPPRRHRHRYHGVFAPNSPLRAAVTARAGQSVEGTIKMERDQQVKASLAKGPKREKKRKQENPPRSRYSWAKLLARIYEVFPLLCPHCGKEMRIIAFITETELVERILKQIGESTEPPKIAPARDPPGWSDVNQDVDADSADPIPEFEMDQRVSW